MPETIIVAEVDQENALVVKRPLRMKAEKKCFELRTKLCHEPRFDNPARETLRIAVIPTPRGPMW